MNEQLPEAFLERMAGRLGAEYGAFAAALAGRPEKGLRLRRGKGSLTAVEAAFPEAVPWEPTGRYLREGTQPGMTLLHEAGAFYIQDPASMMPAAALGVCPGEIVLDLCAAPGGKSTQIGAALRGEGLLVCNEPVPKRAQILSRNIERMGIPNAVVLCETPERLAERWPEAFDAVLADAPCSGEGMFRKDPASRSEWSPEKAAGCANRQREILRSAAAVVRPGGRLVYSTCTWNPDENEGNIAWLLKTFPDFEPVPFQLPGALSGDGTFTCYPHRIRGEGQFTALLRRRGTGGGGFPEKACFPAASREERKILRETLPGLPEATHRFGDVLIRMTCEPDLSGFRVVRAGLLLGESRKGYVIPDHAAAIAADPGTVPCAEVPEEEGLRFLAGESLTGGRKGWQIVTCGGWPLGWAKGSDGTLKNHYPKGLRNGRLIRWSESLGQKKERTREE